MSNPVNMLAIVDSLDEIKSLRDFITTKELPTDAIHVAACNLETVNFAGASFSNIYFAPGMTNLDQTLSNDWEFANDLAIRWATFIRAGSGDAELACIPDLCRAFFHIKRCNSLVRSICSQFTANTLICFANPSVPSSLLYDPSLNSGDILKSAMLAYVQTTGRRHIRIDQGSLEKTPCNPSSKRISITALAKRLLVRALIPRKSPPVNRVDVLVLNAANDLWRTVCPERFFYELKNSKLRIKLVGISKELRDDVTDDQYLCSLPKIHHDSVDTAVERLIRTTRAIKAVAFRRFRANKEEQAILQPAYDFQIRHLLNDVIQDAQSYCTRYTNLFKTVRPKVVLASDIDTYFQRAAILSAEREKVHTVSTNHGYYMSPRFASNFIAQTVCATGAHTFEHIVNSGVIPSNITITGNDRLWPRKHKSPAQIVQNCSKRIVLLTSSTHRVWSMRYREVQYQESLVRTAIALADITGLEVAIKAHPVSDVVEEYRQALVTHNASRVSIIDAPWSTEEFSGTTLAVAFGYASGAVLQLIHLGIPVLYFTGFAPTEHETSFRNIGPTVSTTEECVELVKLLIGCDATKRNAIAENCAFLANHARATGGISPFRVACQLADTE